MITNNVIPICCVCNRVRGQVQAVGGRELGTREGWESLDAFLKRHHIASGDYSVTHTYCPVCARHFRELYKSQLNEQIKRPEPVVSQPYNHATEAILDVFSSVQKCDLDMLVRACPTLTWNQVFSEVDRLSRIGKLRLNYLGRGRYTIELPDTADMPLVAQI